jgi:hypothetical protein
LTIDGYDLGPNGELLALALAAAVPLRIAEYERGLGPQDWDRRRAKGFADVLAEKGDVLQYGGKKGEAAALFNRLADALAVMAFQPGGVRFCGTRYEGRLTPEE